MILNFELFYKIYKYTHMRRHQRRHKGGFLPFLPLIAAAVPALLGSVAGALDIAHKVKTLKSGSGMASKRTVRRRVYRRKGTSAARRRKYGRGIVSDALGGIPLIGPLLASLGSKIGLGYQHGRGLANLNIKSLPYTAGYRHSGMGLYAPGRRGGLLTAAGGKVHVRRGHYRYVRSGMGVKRVHVRRHRVGGYLSPGF
jgi:hypothetical protein